MSGGSKTVTTVDVPVAIRVVESDAKIRGRQPGLGHARRYVVEQRGSVVFRTKDLAAAEAFAGVKYEGETIEQLEAKAKAKAKAKDRT